MGRSVQPDQLSIDQGGGNSRLLRCPRFLLLLFGAASAFQFRLHGREWCARCGDRGQIVFQVESVQLELQIRVQRFRKHLPVQRQSLCIGIDYRHLEFSAETRVTLAEIRTLVLDKCDWLLHV